MASFPTGQRLRGEADQRSAILPVHQQGEKACSTMADQMRVLLKTA